MCNVAIKVCKGINLRFVVGVQSIMNKYVMLIKVLGFDILQPFPVLYYLGY